MALERVAYTSSQPSGRWLPLPISARVTALIGAAHLLALLGQGVGRGELALGTVTLVGLGLAALLALYVWVERRYGEQPPLALAVGVLAGHTLLVAALTRLDGLTFTALLYLTLPFPAVFLFGQRVGVALSAALLAWFTYHFATIKPGWLDDPAMLNTYLLFSIALVLTTAMAQVVQRERANRQQAEQLLRELEAAHHQLLASHAQVAELATVAERNRLARDIHDSLGHYLTVISVQLEKAQLVIDEDLAIVRGAIDNAKRLADQALSDVRHSVGALRRDQAPFRLRPALEQLVANLRVMPFQIRLSVAGEEQGFSSQQLLALYRAVQEGLTNVQRHARAHEVRVWLDLDEREARLILEDDGVGLRGDGVTGKGFGLRGVMERLELVSGRLSVAKAPGGGTRLSVTIPRGSHVEA
jgi:signal transduction histidine kinase